MTDGPGRDAQPLANHRGLPPSVVVLRWIARVYLWAFKRLRVVDATRIPGFGPTILVANHTTSYDPVCLQVACKHRLIRFLQAREYYEERPVHFLYRWLQVGDTKMDQPLSSPVPPEIRHFVLCLETELI